MSAALPMIDFMTDLSTWVAIAQIVTALIALWLLLQGLMDRRRDRLEKQMSQAEHLVIASNVLVPRV